MPTREERRWAGGLFVASRKSYRYRYRYRPSEPVRAFPVRSQLSPAKQANHTSGPPHARLLSLPHPFSSLRCWSSPPEQQSIRSARDSVKEYRPPSPRPGDRESPHAPLDAPLRPTNTLHACCSPLRSACSNKYMAGLGTAPCLRRAQPTPSTRIHMTGKTAGRHVTRSLPIGTSSYSWRPHHSSSAIAAIIALHNTTRPIHCILLAILCFALRGSGCPNESEAGKSTMPVCAETTFGTGSSPPAAY